MTYILIVLVFLLKAFAVLLTAGIVLLILFMVLPVRARVWGSASASVLLQVLFGDEDDDGDDAPIPFQVDYGFEGTVLGGVLGVSMVEDGNLALSVLGMWFRLPNRKGSESARRSVSKKVTGSGADAAAGDQTDNVEMVGDSESAGGVELTEVGSTSSEPKNARGSDVKDGRERGFKNRGSTRPVKGAFSVTRVRQFLSRDVKKKTISTFRSLISSLNFSGALDVTCGFANPGNTGMLVGSYWALGGPKTFRGITFRPVFTGAAFDVSGYGETRIVPARVGFIGIRYLLSREIRPLWRKAKHRGVDANRPAGAATTG